MEDREENNTLSSCINYTHHLHIHYVLCTNESICLMLHHHWQLLFDMRDFKEEQGKKEKQGSKGHLRKVGEVNGSQSISLIIASIVSPQSVTREQTQPAHGLLQMGSEAHMMGGW